MKFLITTLTLAFATGAFAAPVKIIVETNEVTHFESELKTKGVATVGVGGGKQTGSIDAGAAGGAAGGFTAAGSAGGATGGGLIGGVAGGSTGGGLIGGVAGGSTGGGFGFDMVGQVVTAAQGIVGLGESIYTLVQKGKPHNTSEYAPLSIVPKDPMTKAAADPFDMENCSYPVTKKFKTNMKAHGLEVIQFEYMVIYTHSCTFNGAGKYIQTAMIQPVSVRTAYGWDFTASMQLTGVMNHGTKASPIAGALVSLKYTFSSYRIAYEKNDTVHITGNGELKIFTREN